MLFSAHTVTWRSILVITCRKWLCAPGVTQMLREVQPSPMRTHGAVSGFPLVWTMPQEQGRAPCKSSVSSHECVFGFLEMETLGQRRHVSACRIFLQGGRTLHVPMTGVLRSLPVMSVQCGRTAVCYILPRVSVVFCGRVGLIGAISLFLAAEPSNSYSFIHGREFPTARPSRL